MAFLPSSWKIGPDFHLRPDIHFKLSAVIVKHFSRGFFRVTHEGLSEKGTSRKLSVMGLTGEVISLSVTILELLLSGQIQSSLAPFSVVLLLLFFFPFWINGK